MTPPRIAIVNVQVAVDLDKAAAGNPNAAVIVSSKGFKKVVQLKKGGAKVKKEEEIPPPLEEQDTIPVPVVEVEQEEPKETIPKTRTPNSTAASLDDVTSSIGIASASPSDTTLDSTLETPTPRVLRSTKDKHLLSGIKFGKGQRAI